MVNITIAEAAQRFHASEQKIPHVVYDADDVLWPLIHVVARRLRIDIKRASAIFSIRDNPKLSTKEQQAIISAFADPSYFQNIEFYPGTAEILRPRELGAKVSINSNSFNQQIADLKREQLLAAIPGLQPEDLRMNIIDYGGTHHKKFAPDTTILVDDSPHNIALSPAIVNYMPMTVRWAWSPTALDMVAQKPVIWKPDLIAINQHVYDLVAAMMTSAA